MPKHIRVEKVVQLSRKLYTSRATTFNESNEHTDFRTIICANQQCKSSEDSFVPGRSGKAGLLAQNLSKVESFSLTRIFMIKVTHIRGFGF